MSPYSSFMPRISFTIIALLFSSRPLLAGIKPQVQSPAYGAYVVVASQDTLSRPAWKTVVNTLRTKYDGSIIIYGKDVTDVTPALARIMPRYICFVQPPEHAGIAFVTAVQRLTRDLDEDAYTDAMWGILTGYDASDALRIAERTTPLIVQSALSGTEKITLDRFEQGTLYNELEAGGRYTKKPGGAIVKEVFPVDSTQGLVDSFNAGPDAFFTSGHGTTTGWQIGYNYKDGFFKSRAGQLFGRDTQGQQLPINSTNSKVYLPTGNCLIGRIPEKDCFALAMMHAGGVDQMFGYTVVTFFGYMGWGTSTYFIDMPGDYSLAESFYANQQALLYQIETRFPKLLDADFDKFSTQAVREVASAHYPSNREAYGLFWDRDAIAFYGDPAWRAALPPSGKDWQYTLEKNTDFWQLSVKTLADGNWPDRPLVALLPHRLTDLQVLTGEAYMPRLTDNFILVPLSGGFKAGEQFTLTFKGQRAPHTQTSTKAAPIYADKSRAKSDRSSLVLPPQVPDQYKLRVTEALTRASANASELLDVLKNAPAAQVEGACFLIAHMPDRDLTSLSADYLLENITWAYRAKATMPWGNAVPHDIFLNDVLPYASINERRDNWRKDFYERFFDVVKDCKTPGEAAVSLNYNIWKMVNVKYSTKRAKADQSPYESMDQGLASCTGLSVLYIDACRALGVPARFTGVPRWTTKRGNHSWVEVWDRGWHFTGAFEPDQLDRGWFVGDASKADPTNPMHCIYATSFKKTDTTFPCVWNRSVRYVSAVDVTARYIKKHVEGKRTKRVAITLRDKVRGQRIAAEVSISQPGRCIGTGTTRSETNDTNDVLEFELMPDTPYNITFTFQGKTVLAQFTTTQEARQAMSFVWASLDTP